MADELLITLLNLVCHRSDISSLVLAAYAFSISAVLVRITQHMGSVLPTNSNLKRTMVQNEENKISLYFFKFRYPIVYLAFKLQKKYIKYILHLILFNYNVQFRLNISYKY